ncbi:uncharacterized protein LOC134791377 [Cydia splendana]|uniref:uncharacterized protein LOC134791377 n=1 Tax=Cydia splendana TaxID=1100963 RepID=UPI00300D49A5
MMERPPEPKKDEQCPLLKVEIGMPEALRQPTVVPQNWSVTCVPKKSFFQRWPELLSASGMTLVLLGLSFLLFSALGMSAYRRQPLLLQYNDGKPSSNVFLHHIVNKGCRLPLELYSQYLESMAVTYPNLRFNVFFLIDDSTRHPYYISRHGRLPSRWFGFPNKDMFHKHSCLKEFERRYPNINITIMALNKYMAMTPLRFKWRAIPVSYLTFYARVFSVWQNGGIGMDLTTYNNQFSNNFRFDQRINEILKNHNDGLPVTDYNVMLQAIDDEEENSFKCLKQMLNNTLSMFNNFFSFGLPSQMEQLPSNDTPIIRTQRGKRNAVYNFYDIVTSEITASTAGNMVTDKMPNATMENVANNLKENSSNNDSLKSEISQTTSESVNVTSTETMIQVNQGPELQLASVGLNKSNNSSEGPQAVLFYDISIMSDKFSHFLLREPVWPAFMLSGSDPKSEVEDIAKRNNTNIAAQLALGSDGLFIAAADKMHPFLGMLITAGFQRMRPEFAIQDTLITQCSGVYRNQAYCSIYNL